ncbi:Rv1535 family protein [Mycobacterium sp. Aquia_213]|uniref:Rv1535 family protein n=1 Tax=Mycobacterium sp. Aquia_213 TaxID=2991728 RepID=UPI00226D7E2F|nr:Rv1535 family protein [Mycobacterium sp. Aquia_213]WAC89446.1 Rv1535 family protein [Mycobacterium sp. Aquia_213]
MTAVLFDEVVAVAPVRNLRVVRDTTPTQAPAPKKVARPADAGYFGAGDPLVAGAARLLSVPVRHVYAALWRVGVLEVKA